MFTYDEKLDLLIMLRERLNDMKELQRIFSESKTCKEKEWMIERYQDKINRLYQIAIKLEIDPSDIEYGIE